MRRPSSRALAASLALAGALTSGTASAEPPWVDRHVTLPARDWAFDFGIGIAHDSAPPRYYPTGAGLNLEGAVSPIDGLELGLRTGVRFANDGRFTQADRYGRLFDRETFGTNNDIAANPELRIRGALLRSRIVEVALEGRAYLPVEQYSQFGVLFGVPLLFHFGHVVRLDTGIYAPVVFYNPPQGSFSVPIDVWIQATDRLWLGPMSGFVFHTANNRAELPIGFGLGYQILRTLDLKTQFLFPAVNETQGAQTFGFGVGIQVRIE